MKQPSYVIRSSGLLLLGGLLLGLSACGGRPEAGASEEVNTGTRRREIPQVRTCQVEEREMIRLLETTSVLESEFEVQVFPRLAGQVVEVVAEEGDPVQVGQVLARIDDRDLVLALEDAEVALQEAINSEELAKLLVEDADAKLRAADLAVGQAVRDHKRNEVLFQGGETASALSRQALETSRLAQDNAKSEFDQMEIAKRRCAVDERSAKIGVDRARVARDRAQLALDHTRIVAPFDGVVAMRNVRVGDKVGTGEAVYVLTDTETLRAVFYRPQEELQLFAGAAVGGGGGKLTLTAIAEAHPEVEFEGFVQRISPTIDPESGQFRVTARLNERDGDVRLLPGMLIRMRIVTDRHEDALVVPKRSLRREGERRFLLAVNQPEAASGSDETYTLRRVDVTEGYTTDELVEVFPEDSEALGAGTTVVLVGSKDLSDGDPVTFAPAPSGSSGPSEDRDTTPVAATGADEQAAQGD